MALPDVRRRTTRSSSDACTACGTPFAPADPTGRARGPGDAAGCFGVVVDLPGAGARKAGRPLDGLARGMLFTMTFGLALLIGWRGPGRPVFARASCSSLGAGVYLGSASEAHRVAAGGGLFVSSRPLMWATVGLMLLSVISLAVVRGTRDGSVGFPAVEHAEGSIEIDAPLEDVMEVIEDYEAYPEWAEVNRADPATGGGGPRHGGAVRGRRAGARKGHLHAFLPLRPRRHGVVLDDQGGAGGHPRHPRRVPARRALRRPHQGHVSAGRRVGRAGPGFIRSEGASV